MTTSSFASDNNAGIHPEVMASIIAADAGDSPSYGDDLVTAAAVRLLRREFGPQAEVFLTFNGTGANVVGLQAMVRSFEAVVCAETAHINVDECGAPEKLAGIKLIDVATPDGKLTPALIESAIRGAGDQHHVQVKVVSITQSSELGTVYSLDEIRDITSWSHAHGLLVHLDGARLANAASSLGVDLGELGSSAGIDMMSFGGTKNGAMGAEAVIALRPELASSLPFIRKQSMQLASKMRYVSAQFVALLTDELWRRNASYANAMALRLSSGLAGAQGVTITHEVAANAVFAIIDPSATRVLQAEFPFYVWDEATGQVRWMTSWSSKESDVDTFASRIRAVAASVTDG